MTAARHEDTTNERFIRWCPRCWSCHPGWINLKLIELLEKEKQKKEIKTMMFGWQSKPSISAVQLCENISWQRSEVEITEIPRWSDNLIVDYRLCLCLRGAVTGGGICLAATGSTVPTPVPRLVETPMLWGHAVWIEIFVFNLVCVLARSFLKHHTRTSSKYSNPPTALADVSGIFQLPTAFVNKSCEPHSAVDVRAFWK